MNPKSNLINNDKRWGYEYLKLELLTTRQLTSNEWRAIELGRRSPTDPQFRAAMPMIVARFQDAAQREIMQRAERMTKTRSCALILGFSLGDYLGETTKALRRDMQKIHTALWHGDITSQEFEMGHYRKPRTLRLHEDHSSMKAEITYISRLGDLPFEVISCQTQVFGTDAEKQMIANAILQKDSALDPLRCMNILQQAILSDVVMMLSTPQHVAQGNLHCSTPVPKGGVASAFFRATGTISPAFSG